MDNETLLIEAIEFMNQTGALDNFYDFLSGQGMDDRKAKEYIDQLHDRRW